MPLTYSITQGNSAGVVGIFDIKILKLCKLFRNKLSPVITKYFWWTAENTNPVLKKVLNNNSRAFAFNNGGITKSGECVNYIKIPNVFINSMKIYCNSVIECCCSWYPNSSSRKGFLWVLQTMQLSQTLLISFKISVESYPAFCKRLFKLLGAVWPNCLCNFTSFERFLYLSSSVSNIKQCSMESKLHTFSGKISTA